MTVNITSNTEEKIETNSISLLLNWLSICNFPPLNTVAFTDHLWKCGRTIDVVFVTQHARLLYALKKILTETGIYEEKSTSPSIFVINCF